jgi:16S rRNA (guanine(966)-N(2))-methyltransferase RsmD
VLELFAGSGAQALEAISRGAQSAILVDSGKIAAATICENIKRCHFEQMTEFIRQDVYRALPGLVDSGPFDLILLDPPYRENHIPQVIEKIESLNLLAKNGILCAESAKNEEFNDLGSMTLLRSKVYGTTRIHLYGQLKD